MKPNWKRAVLGALLVLVGGCTQEVPSQVSDATCKAGEVLAGAGPDQPLKCVALSSLSLASATHAAHAGRVDRADHAQTVDTALVADRGLSLAPEAPLILGASTPTDGVRVQVEGPVFLDGHPLARLFLTSSQAGPATSGTSNNTLFSLQVDVATPGIYRFELSGSVNAGGKLDGTAYGLCEIRLDLDNTSTSTTVASLGSASAWSLTTELSLSTGSFPLTVSLLSPNGTTCTEDPSNSASGTRPAWLSVEVVGA